MEGGKDSGSSPDWRRSGACRHWDATLHRPPHIPSRISPLTLQRLHTSPRRPDERSESDTSTSRLHPLYPKSRSLSDPVGKRHVLRRPTEVLLTRVSVSGHHALPPLVRSPTHPHDPGGPSPGPRHPTVPAPGDGPGTRAHWPTTVTQSRARRQPVTTVPVSTGPGHPWCLEGPSRETGERAR